MPATDQTWSKPAAIAIPKEGYFELERGRYGPVYPAHAGMLRLLDHRQGQGGARRGRPRVRQADRRGDQGQPRRARAAAAALPALGCSSMSGRGCTSSTRASSAPTSTSTPRTRWRCSARPESRQSSTNLEGFPEDWHEKPGCLRQVRPRAPVPRAFWNTVSIPM